MFIFLMNPLFDFESINYISRSITIRASKSYQNSWIGYTLTKLSIITASYNCEYTIAQTIESIFSQSYPEIQTIVIDGASTDGTLSAIEPYRSQLSIVISEPDLGIYDALNKGILLSSGDVVGFLHADDIYAHDNVLLKVAQTFADPSVCALYGDLQYVHQEDISRVIRQWASCPFHPNMLRRGWMPPHPTLYVRKEWYQRIGGFDINYRISADYFSVLQLFSHPDFKAAYLPELMIKMRVGGASNRSLKNIIRKSCEDYNALRRSNFGTIVALKALALKNFSKIGQFFRKDWAHENYEI